MTLSGRHPLGHRRTLLLQWPVSGWDQLPAIAGRLQAAFMRLIRARHPDMLPGKGDLNTWCDERAATLAPRWRDGTGTGGTNDVHAPQSMLDMWMGIASFALVFLLSN
jgi:hypothetical protein